MKITIRHFSKAMVMLLCPIFHGAGHAEDKSATRNGLVSLPSAGGTVRKEGGAFQVQNNTGSVGFSLPLPSLPGRGGVVPDINLQYSQFSGDTGSGFGVGWSLSVPSIEFDGEMGTIVTARKGEKGEGDFYSRLTLQGERLAFLKRADKALIYAPERGSAYVKVEYFEAPFEVRYLGRANGFEAQHFEQGFIVTQANGSREIFSGNSGEAERSGQFVIRWPLAMKIAPTGEAIRYFYRQEGGRSYVKTISFAGGRSSYEFEFMPTRGSIVSFHNATEQKNSLLINSVRAIFDNKVTGQLCFAYLGRDLKEPAKFSIRTAQRCQNYADKDVAKAVDPQSLSVLDSLVAVYRFGRTDVLDQSTPRDPSIYLDYSSWTQGDLTSRPLAYAPPGLDWLKGISPELFELADFNHDGLVDIVRSTQDQNNPLEIALGTGNLLKAFMDPLKWFLHEWRGSAYATRGASLAQNNFHFVDLDGDSFSDIVNVEFNTLKLYRKNYFDIFDKNLANREDINKYFQDKKIIPVTDISPEMFKAGRTQFIDLNQDGYTDIFTTLPSTSSTGFVSKIWMNISASPNGSAKEITFDEPFELPLYDKELSLTNSNVRLMDITGDKLPDLVRFKQNGFCVAENRGNLFDVNAQKSGVALFGDPSRDSQECGRGSRFVELKGLHDWQNARDLWFVDVNGDGIVDAAKMGDTPTTLLVWLGLGSGNFIAEPIKFNLGVRVVTGDESKFRSRVADIDGDGQQEIVIMQFVPGEAPVVVIDFNRLKESKQLIKANLLTTMRFESGLRHDVRYTTSMDEILRDRANNLDTNALHFPVAMAKQVTTTEGKLSSVEEYLYHKPVYDHISRKFLGFEVVEKIAYGDNFEGGGKTQAASYTKEDYYISTEHPEMRGELKRRSVRAFEARGSYVEEQKSSASLDFSKAEIHSMGDYARTQSLPQPGKLLSETVRNVVSVPAYGGENITFIRELGSTSQECDQTESACALSAMGNYEFDIYNLPARTRNVHYAITGPKGLLVPGRGTESVTDYKEARNSLSALGIVSSPSMQKTYALNVNVGPNSDPSSLQVGMALSQQGYSYVSTNGLLERNTRSVFSSEGTEKGSIVTRYIYDSFGNKIEESDNLGLREKVTFDESGVLYFSTQNALGHTDQVFYEELASGAPAPMGFSPEGAPAGTPSHMRNARGEWLFIDYDSLGRKIKTVTSSGREERYAYLMGIDGKPSLIYVVVRRYKDGENIPKGEAQFVEGLQALNSSGTELAKLESGEKKGSRVLNYSQYNRNKLKIREWTPYLLPEVEIKDIFQDLGEIPFNGDHYSFTRYDELGRVREVVVNKSRTERTSYHPWGFEVGIEFDNPRSGRRETVTKYQISRGNTVYAILDELGQIFTYDRDLRNHLQAITLPNTPARKLAFDSEGKMEWQEIPGIGRYVYTYNSRGSLVREERYSSSGEKNADLVNELDALERVVKVNANGVNRSVSSYDSYATDVSLPSSALTRPFGLLTSTKIYDPNRLMDVSHTLIYGENGKPIEHRRKLGTMEFNERYNYTLDGVERTITDPTGVVRNISLGRSLRLTSASIKLPWSSTIEPIMSDVRYNAKGLVEHIEYRAGSNTDLEYDADTLLPIHTQSSAKDGGIALQDFKLSYDGRNNVVTIDDKIKESPLGLVNRSATFDFNGRNELVGATRFGKSLAYQYAGNGSFVRNQEMSEESLLAGSSSTSLIPASPANSRYEFDTSGRLLANGKMLTARYDAFGKLIYAKTAAAEIWLGYDGTGKRLYRRVISGGRTVDSYYPTQTVIVENGEPQSFVFVGANRMARIDHAKKQWFYYLKDQVGSSEILMSSDGTPVEQMLYMPYGTELNPILLDAKWDRHLQANKALIPNQITKHRFAGHYLDTDLGFYDFVARNYDPRLGRFLQPDPLYIAEPEKCVTSPLDCNLFGYARNNPLTYTDPTGLEPTKRKLDTENPYTSGNDSQKTGPDTGGKKTTVSVQGDNNDVKIEGGASSTTVTVTGNNNRITIGVATGSSGSTGGHHAAEAHTQPKAQPTGNNSKVDLIIGPIKILNQTPQSQAPQYTPEQRREMLKQEFARIDATVAASQSAADARMWQDIGKAANVAAGAIALIGAAPAALGLAGLTAGAAGLSGGLWVGSGILTW